MATVRYPIRLGRRSMPLLRLFGVRGPSDAWAELDFPELKRTLEQVA